MIRLVYDPHYIEERDKLIPLAERYASALAMPCPSGMDTHWDGGFSKLFANKMQQLAMERGLTCGMPREQELV